MPVTAPWHLALLYLLVAATTKFRFSCVAVNVFESREDTRCLLESYLFSGGLADVISSVPSQCFVHSLFDRPDDYAALHAWLDTRFPEPAWRRKRQPVDESLELRYLAVLTHLCRRDTLLLRCHEQLAGEGHERAAGARAAGDAVAPGAVSARASAQEEAGVRRARQRGVPGGGLAQHGGAAATAQHGVAAREQRAGVHRDEEPEGGPAVA